MNPEQRGHDLARLKIFHREVEDRVSADSRAFRPSPGRPTCRSGRALRAASSFQGQEQQRKSETLSTVTNTIDVDYFKTMHIPLLQGRAFTEADQEGSLSVVVINEDLARRYWPHGNAIGNHLRLSGDTVRAPDRRGGQEQLTTPPWASRRSRVSTCRSVRIPEACVVLYVRSAGDPRSCSQRYSAASRKSTPTYRSAMSAPAQSS